MTRALESLKNFHFNGLLLNKVFIVWARKEQRHNFSWKLRKIQNLERNQLVVSKLAWGIWQNLTRALELKVSKLFILMGSFLAKNTFFGIKKNRGIIFHETEEGYKIWRAINLSFWNWHKELVKIWTEHSKVSKTFALIGSYWAKYIFFELK